MTQLFSNNGQSTLNGAILIGDLTITLDDTSGMPAPSGADYFLLTLTDFTNQEIVKVTDNTANVLTVVRGYEGTAQAWIDGTVCQMNVTKDTLETLQAKNTNILINADFRVNEREYVSGTATAGANEYALDRWRIVTSGQSISFTALGTDNTITCPAGGLEQVVIALNIYGGLYAVSWIGTATCTVNGTARTSGESFTLTANATATVKFSSGTVKDAQLERGGVATEFKSRPLSQELDLCLRYFERQSYLINSYVSVGQCQTASIVVTNINFSEKITPPSVSDNGSIIFAIASGTSAGGSYSYSVINNHNCRAVLTGGSGLVAGNASMMSVTAATYIDFDSEL